MKQILTILIISTSLVGADNASADTWGQPQAPPLIDSSSYFGPGLTVNPFGLYLAPDADRADDTFGGGFSFDYFFSRNIGVSASAAWADPGTDEVWHNYTIDLVLRAPIDSLNLAPYVLVGGGAILEDDSEILGRAGVGLDLRFSESFGIFGDWIYNFPGGSGDLEDYQMIRVGVKFGF